jgi:hypothetical protein
MILPPTLRPSLFALHWLVFLFVNGAMLYAALRLTRVWACGELIRAEAFMLAIVLMSGQIIVTQIVLGLVGWLSWWPVMILNGGLALAVIAWTARLPRRAYRVEVSDDRKDYLVVGVWLVIGAILAIQLLKVIGAPPFGIDSLGYHLPKALDWLQSGSLLSANPVSFFYYPGVSELFDVWLMLPFRDSLLVNLQSWPFAVMAVLAIYSLARRVGLPIRWAAYSGLFFLSIRAVQGALGFANYQDNDIVLAGLFLAAGALAIAAVEGANRGLIIGEGIALGLLIGVKFSGPGYALLIIGAHILFAVTRHNARRLLVDLAILIGSMALVGGFWYLHNWITLGNPVPPYAIQLAGQTIFPGRDGAAVMQTTTLLGNIANPQALPLLLDGALLPQGGFAVALTLLLLVLATLKLLVNTVRRQYWSAVRFVVQIVWPWGALLMLLVTPFGATNIIGQLNQLEYGYSPIRFGLPLWALGGILLAQLLHGWFRRQDSWLPDALAVLFSVHGWITLLIYQHEFAADALSRSELMNWLLVLVGAFLLERVWRNAAWRSRYKISALLGVAAISTLVVWPKYENSFPARVEFYENKSPVSSLIRRQVFELEAQRVNVIGAFSDWLALYNPGFTPRYIFCSLKLDWWRQCIRDQDVDTVFFIPQEQTAPGGSLEAKMLAAYADEFERVPSNDRIHVYRVMH